jgi:site-specific recombinase XerC
MIDPRRLIALGIELMDGAASETRTDQAARQYRDGLLIALLTTRPLRRRSLAALALDRHVKRVGTGYVLALDGERTKSGKPIEFPLPAWLSPYFERYLSHFRRLFPRAAEQQALWLSSRGGRLGAEAIYDRVCRRTETAFGFPIHPQLFRAIAATTIAREAPAKLTIARDLLTHANLATTAGFYARARTMESARKYAVLLARLRSVTAPPGDGGSRHG